MKLLDNAIKTLAKIAAGVWLTLAISTIIGLLFLLSTGCQSHIDDELDYPSRITRQKKAKYWGCWREATGNRDLYDLILQEGSGYWHNITIGDDCGETAIVSLDIGFFRNDTLILDDGKYEYWAFLQGDTLLYSAYVETTNPIIERLIKI